MDGVLEEATVLCTCKLACSLPFLPSLSTFSPVSFCCCCLLLFTDVLLTVFLAFLCVLERWQMELNPPGGEIALRALLFISHTYGAVFLLTVPAITANALITRLLPLHQDTSCGDRLKVDKSGEKNDEKPMAFHVVGYLCCLSLWIYGTLNIRWRWRLEEVWTAACLHSTDSLLTCLPNIFSPMLRFAAPGWALALLYLVLVIVLIISTFRSQALTHILTDPVTTSDPKRTESGGSPGESGLVTSPKGDRTEKVIPLIFSVERFVEAQSGSPGWAFPFCSGADVMIGVMCALFVFVLPLNLSLNIQLISSIEKLMELSVKYFSLSNSVVPYNNLDMI